MLPIRICKPGLWTRAARLAAPLAVVFAAQSQGLDLPDGFPEDRAARQEMLMQQRMIDSLQESSRMHLVARRQQQSAGKPLGDWSVWRARLEKQAQDAPTQRLLGELRLAGLGQPADASEALAWLSKAAAGGDARAQVLEAAVVLSGRTGAHAGRQDAFRLLQDRAAQGDGLAMYAVGQALVEGRIVVRDLPQARQWFERGAKAGNSQAELALGRARYAGLGGPVDMGGGAAALAHAAAIGNRGAQLTLEMARLQGAGMVQDKPRALKAIQALAEAGDFAAQCDWGSLLFDGRATGRPDVPKALATWRKAAEQGSGRAHNLLGTVYREGLYGVVKDDALARAHALQGAALGDSHAQDLAGEVLLLGIGGAADQAQALRWFRAAANQGESYAIMRLAVRLLEGLDGPADLAKARDYMGISANLGQAQAQYMFGQMLEKGVGGASDKPDAARWYRAAADQGHTEAGARLKALLGTSP